jgi:hypothetical protein
VDAGEVPVNGLEERFAELRRDMHRAGYRLTVHDDETPLQRRARGELVSPQMVKRDLGDHPGPHAPNGFQHYACERPEDPDIHGVLFHTGCPKCVVVLQAAVAHCQGNILMFHGMSEGPT